MLIRRFVCNRPLPNLVTAVRPDSPLSTAYHRTGRETASASPWLIVLSRPQSKQVHSTANASLSPCARKYVLSIWTFFPSTNQTVGPRSSRRAGSLQADTPSKIATVMEAIIARSIWVLSHFANGTSIWTSLDHVETPNDAD